MHVACSVVSTLNNIDVWFSVITTDHELKECLSQMLLVKSCSDTFSILIAHLTNLSFTQGIFPSKFKLAQISPLLKKPGLSKSDPSNFRPISNLNTIGKIMERLALARLLSISPSFSPHQSAYRKFHSTETALLKLTNDIMDTIDSERS